MMGETTSTAPACGRGDRGRGRMRAQVTALLWEGHSLRAIASRRGTPTLGTLNRWLADDADFLATYKRIRWTQRNIMMLDELLPIAAEAASYTAVLRLYRAARAWRAGLKAKAIQAERDALNRRMAGEQ